MFGPEAMLGFVRHLDLLIRRKEIAVTGFCRRCGACCRGLILQVDGGFLTSPAMFADVCRRFPEYRRFGITGRSPGGDLVFSCSLLGPDGACTGYAGRPDFCRSYPSAATYLLGQNVRPGCGYRFTAVAREKKPGWFLSRPAPSAGLNREDKRPQ